MPKTKEEQDAEYQKLYQLLTRLSSQGSSGVTLEELLHPEKPEKKGKASLAADPPPYVAPPTEEHVRKTMDIRDFLAKPAKPVLAKPALAKPAKPVIATQQKIELPNGSSETIVIQPSQSAPVDMTPPKKGRPVGWARSKKETDRECPACNRIFNNDILLSAHQALSNPCKMWMALPVEEREMETTPLHYLLEPLMEEAMTGPKPLHCKFCNSKNTTVSNHHRHFTMAMACNRLAIREFKRIIKELE
jgi:hypothetical protein